MQQSKFRDASTRDDITLDRYYHEEPGPQPGSRTDWMIEMLKSLHARTGANAKFMAVVNHVGTMPTNGHYYAYVDRGGIWYWMDDTAIQ